MSLVTGGQMRKVLLAVEAIKDGVAFSADSRCFPLFVREIARETDL